MGLAIAGIDNKKEYGEGTQVSYFLKRDVHKHRGNFQNVVSYMIDNIH